MIKVYVILEEYSGPELNWADDKIYSSVDNALKYFDNYSDANIKITITDCDHDDYFSRDMGLLKNITIQDNKYSCRRNFYIKEIVVQ